jgi:DNA-binding MarR family transcriptional regulator
MAQNHLMARTRTSLASTPAGNLAEAALKPLIGYQIAQASVTANRIYEATVGKPLGLHRLAFSILVLVQGNPGCTVSSLSKALNLSMPNTVLWVDRIMDKGWLARVPNESDRRSNHLRLTAEGVGMVEQATVAVLAGEEATLHNLSQAERAILAELLHKVALSRDRAPLG